MLRLFLLLLIPAALQGQPFTRQEISRWKQEATQVNIIRDKWGIPHIYGKTDANAVFGLLYAQCEDDFPRVEMNYIEKLGRMSEVQGKEHLGDDLLLRLLIDSVDAVADYRRSPSWLRKLMDAYANGINYFLYTHPDIKPALLTRFKPWYPLLWTDGSIGAINTADITAGEVSRFYLKEEHASFYPRQDEFYSTGSNGFAISGKKTLSGKAMLYINPHVTFYFRPEVHMVSEEGLNVYGAVTWGQFFVYQGFNEHCGWMHTSNYTDVADTYKEQVIKKAESYVYKYDSKELPVKEKTIRLRFREGNAVHAAEVKSYYTGHGPVMTQRDGQWVSLRSNNRSLDGLIQCWQRNKAKSFADYKKVMDLRANTSNSTVYADAEGNIAYWHGNFMPRRDPKLDWSKPVDGTTSATEWKGLHTVEELVHIYNPSNGWLQNCNSTPFTAAGVNSPKRQDYSYYMAPDGENFRGINAVNVLAAIPVYDIDSLIKAGYDTKLSAFDYLLPSLITAAQSLENNDKELADAISELSKWDHRVSEQSIATTLGITWAEKLIPAINMQKLEVLHDFVDRTLFFAKNATPEQLLHPFAAAIKELNQRYGTWRKPWGDINRFQRIRSNIESYYNDSLPSLPVAFASSVWGMIPAYGSKYFPNTNKRYGVHGNSFICAVEFGSKVKARSLLAGGESGNSLSHHFFDQGMMYTKGQFKDVLFYKEDVLKHAEQSYHPGTINHSVKPN